MPKTEQINMPLEVTAFTKDIMGRWVYNTLAEAKKGPVDVLVVGGGSFGAIFAEHLFRLEAPESAPTHPPHRIVVLEAGPHGLPEHFQNLPVGLNPPIGIFKDELDVAPTNVPWTANIPFTGLYYVVGGRSLFWGGWSPELLDSEMPQPMWPRELVEDLKGRRFPEAKRQLGTDTTNDFVFGPLHGALRRRLFEGVRSGDLPFAFRVASEEDLEAPLAVQSASPRSGFFPMSKFSAVPLLISASRQAGQEVGFDPAKDGLRRLMVVPNCRVTKLNMNGERVESADVEYAEIAPQGAGGAARLERTVKQDKVQLSARGKVVIALGTIESTRLAKNSFDRPHMGRNLMAHLRSNLVVRFPRSTFQHLPSELAGSALFLKGRSQNGHFHFQITAFGNPTELTLDQERELFKAVPTIDHLDYFLQVDDRFIVMVIRGIGEMEPDPKGARGNRVEVDAAGMAKVTLQASAKDGSLWEDMDAAAEGVARVFARGGLIEYLWEYDWGDAWRTVPPPHAPRKTKTAGVRDGLGTTHHEAGPLWMGELGADPSTSVTDTWGRFHHVANTYVASPALFPSVGSPNPMLTGTALARRTAHKLARAPLLTAADGAVEALAGAERSNWRMAGGGTFVDAGPDGIRAEGGMGLYWYARWSLRNFRLTVEWRAAAKADNSGIFLRFPEPANNPWAAVDRGYEVQIDDLGRHDDPAENGKLIYKTGAIYGIQAPTKVASKDPASADPWNVFVIEVAGQRYDVRLNGEHVVVGFAGDRGAEGYVGLQSHGSPVLFRRVLIEPLAV